ncbi:ZIP family metal transporter [Candidatus Woesearchaeota archaeon]|nr:ZIP family metal transporter [Candidatus Woesearchaeota archaeon]
MPVLLYTLVSVVIVSIFSLVGVTALLFNRKSLEKFLLVLVSLSAGTLLGGAVLHLLPEAIEQQGSFTIRLGLLTISGVLVFFLIERFIHLQNTCKIRPQLPHKHLAEYPLIHESHKKHIGILNLLGDALHNFSDGIIIAVSYFVSIPAGIATTIAVILHEVPQEIADFGVLLYSGFSKGKALLLNLASAGVAVVGAIVGIAIGSGSAKFISVILPFAAGGFLYIAGTNLFPELHKECSWKESVIHFIALLAGIGIMVALLGLK